MRPDQILGLRNYLALTQREMGETLALSQSMISRLERGVSPLDGDTELLYRLIDSLLARASKEEVILLCRNSSKEYQGSINVQRRNILNALEAAFEATFNTNTPHEEIP